ncbi:MAG: hypothetical protein HY393_03590 [Candidatus Diapherotrites archaeon]|nr:hypothetical protein [Candidatus Diapherotrites archaeon]
MVSKAVLYGALGLAIIIIAGLVYFYQPFRSGEGNPLTLKLGPGGCLDEKSCKSYCEGNLQECIDWCTKNEHALCEAIAGEYLGGVDGGVQGQGKNAQDAQSAGIDIGSLLGPGGCLGGADCVAYCEGNLQECIEWCETHEHALCEIITNQYLPPG